ncbi:MAG: HPr family phosphocarrier protein [Planctomycetota bacterium]
MLVEKNIKIINKLGIHVRPSTQIADITNKHQSKIVFIKDGLEINARSIIELLTLAAGCNADITIRAEGDDAEAVVNAVIKLVESKFGEE